MADDNHDNLPLAVIEWINRKAAAYKPKSSGKNQQQYRAGLILECTSRAADLRHYCEGISDDDLEAALMSSVGKGYKALTPWIAHHAKLHALAVAKERDIEKARAEGLERQNAQIGETISMTVQATVQATVSTMQPMMEKMFSNLALAATPTAAIVDNRRPNGEDHSQADENNS